MELERKLVTGAYKFEAQGGIGVTSRGSNIEINAEGGDSHIMLEAMSLVGMATSSAHVSVEHSAPGAGVVTLLAGPLGKIVQAAGPPMIGPRIMITKDSITLAVGPPGVGASIELGLDGITLKHGLTKISLSGLEGIEESVAANSRKLNAVGHEFAAAETNVKVAVAGIVTKAPIIKEEAMAMSQVKAAILNVAADGIQQVKAGIDMIG